MARSAFRWLAPGLVVAAAVSLAGCIKETDDVTVAADGSGKYTESMSIDLSAMKGIEEAFKGMGPAAPADPGAGMDGEKPADKPKDDDPLEKLKQQWKGIEGLEVTKATKEEKDGKLSVHVEASFKTLEVYARATGQELSSQLKKNDNGSYTLRFFEGEDEPAAEPAMGEGAAMDTAPKGEDLGAGMAAAFIPMLEPYLKDLEIVRKLTLPGTIVETNGTKSEDGSTVTWKVTFADIKKGGKMPAQSVTFKADGLDWKPFLIKRAHEGMGGEAGGPGGPAPK
jgi:hypothetical protein